RVVRAEVPVGEPETEAVIKIGVAFGRGDDEPEYGREEIDDAHAQGDDAHRAPEGGRSGERGDPPAATAPFHCPGEGPRFDGSHQSALRRCTSAYPTASNPAMTAISSE